MFWASKRRVEELEQKLAELEGRQDPDAEDLRQLQTQVDGLKSNPVVKAAVAAGDLSEQMPKWLRRPLRWVYVLTAVGVLSAVTALLTLIFLYRETEAVREQTVVMRKTLEQQQEQIKLQQTNHQAQLDQQQKLHKEQMDRQAGLIEKQDEVLRQQRADFERQRQDTRAQRALTEHQIEQQDEALRQQRADFEKQRQDTQAQMALTEQQIEKQDADTRIVRRAQLLNTIYELSDCDLEKERRKHAEAIEVTKKRAEDAESFWSALNAKRDLAVLEGREVTECPPKSALRVRQEAMLGLYQLDGEKLNLRFANFSGAYLSNVELTGANLSEANLFDADLTEANLFKAILYGVDLKEAMLSRVDFREARLVNADLRFSIGWDSDLSGAELTGANLSGAKFIEANLSMAHLGGADLANALLGRAQFVDADLRDANLYGAELTGANLSKAKLIGTNLSRADLREANLFKAELTGANLLRADLRLAKLSGAVLIGADLRKADLWRVDLRKANLWQVDLTAANLRGADLSDVRNLTQEQLSAAIGDSRTHIPSTLKRPDHWKTAGHVSRARYKSGRHKDSGEVEEAGDTRLGERVQLLNTIYALSGCDLEGEWHENTKVIEVAKRRETRFKWPLTEVTGPSIAGLESWKVNAYPPEAAQRFQEEAVLALYQLDGKAMNLADSNLSGVDLSGRNLVGTELTRANLNGVNFSRANLAYVMLMEAKLIEANLMEADLRNADLSRASLRGTKVNGANFNWADLSEADFREADLREANFFGAKLTGADLYGADLSAARNLTQHQISTTCGDSETKIPSKSERSEHWLDHPWEGGAAPTGCPPKTED